MKLQTRIPLEAATRPISYESRIVLLGSCFATHIAGKLDYFKFRTLKNPFGILFHPKAISTFLWRVMNQELYVGDELLFHKEQWHCFDAHSSLSHPDQDMVLSTLNNALVSSLQQLQHATHVVITLGTAWGYRLRALEEFVANCHKVPQNEFNKILLSVPEIVESLEHCTAYLRAINPNATVVFTVSPVRHLKDGFVDNTRSKSHLIAGVHELISKVKNCAYFPSYELMMDELRDYRFYDSDMLHPSPTAISYIWERFCEIWTDEQTRSTMEQVNTVQKMIQHRPFNPDSNAHQTFLKQLQQRKAELQSSYSFFEF